jgi:hypothetical protein
MSMRVVFSVLPALGLFAICYAVGAQSADDWTPPGRGVAADSQVSAPAVVPEQQLSAQFAADRVVAAPAWGFYYPAPARSGFDPNAPSPDAIEDEQESHSVWYGWQTLASDAAAGAVIALGMAIEDHDTQNETIAIVTLGVATYAFGAPIVHALHRRPGIAVADFGLRVGAPVVAGLVGVAVANAGCPEPRYPDEGTQFDCEMGGAALGVIVGVGSAIAIDSAVFARETKPAPRTQSARGFSLTPSLSLTPHRSALKLIGTF